MSKFWNAIPLMGGLIFLTGCPAPQKRSERLTPLSPGMAAPVEVRPAPVPAPEPRVSSVPPPAAIPRPKPVPPRLTPAPVTATAAATAGGWIRLEAWSQQVGLGVPQPLKNSSHLRYEFRHPQLGMLLLTVGNPTVIWNGIQMDLAYGPQWTNGHAMIHSLDAAKSLTPLFQSRRRLPAGGRTVVIDPGHGGDNWGARSAIGRGTEKEFALDWALRLRPLLEARGWRVLLTRTNDVDITLSNRVAFAERHKADLFVSLHFNSAVEATAHRPIHGVETYCLTPAGLPSSVARQFDDDSSVRYPNNRFDQDNVQYAARLHQVLVAATRRRDRGVRRARFMTVLQGQNRPAILLEAGYLTDPEEAGLIATSAYRQKLAEAVAQALAP